MGIVAAPIPLSLNGTQEGPQHQVSMENVQKAPGKVTHLLREDRGDRIVYTLSITLPDGGTVQSVDTYFKTDEDPNPTPDYQEGDPIPEVQYRVTNGFHEFVGRTAPRG